MSKAFLFQAIQFIQTVLIQTIQFQCQKQFNFKQFSLAIWPIDRTISSARTPSQSGPGSNGNERVLRIPQIFNITGISPSDYLVSYLGHSLGEWGFLPSAEMQLVYCTAPADWTNYGSQIGCLWYYDTK